MKLSIIMPVWNVPYLTKRALDSIPWDEDLEVIVVDDHSEQETVDILKRYENMARIVYLEENHRPNYCRNLALDMCRGEYMFGMDCDDYLITDEFRRAMKELDGTDMVFINQEVNSGFVFELCEENKYHYCAFWTKFVRRDLIGDTRCPMKPITAGDYDFNLEIMKKPHTEKYTGIVAYHYNFPREGSLIWKKNHGLV